MYISVKGGKYIFVYTVDGRLKCKKTFGEETNARFWYFPRQTKMQLGVLCGETSKHF